MKPERKRRVDPARAAHKAQRRETLIDAVAHAVRAHGAGTSMDVIAADVGVAKPVLYRYFGSRHGLNVALAERVTGSLTWELQDALTRDAGPRALLRVSIDTYLAFVEREPQLYRWLTQWAQSEEPQAVAGLMAQLGEEIGKLLAERLEAFGLDPAPAMTWAYGIVGMVHLAGDRWLDRQDVPRDQLVDQLVTLLWSGISGYASEGTSRPSASGAEEGGTGAPAVSRQSASATGGDGPSNRASRPSASGAEEGGTGAPAVER